MDDLVLVPAVVLVVADGVDPDALRSTAETLRGFGVEAVELSGATPDELARAGVERTSAWRAVVVASADAQLPAALARVTALPVVRVPWASGAADALGLLRGVDGNLPAAADAEEPFATVAIGPAGAKNAALFVVSVLALDDARLRAAWEAFRAAQTEAVLNLPPPSLD